MVDANSNIESPSSANTTNPNFILVNPANQLNTVKLNDDNYLLWHLQVLACIRGLGLDVFILENTPIPPQFITGNNSHEGLNPAYISWCRQDQLLFSFLLASMTEDVQAQMIGCETSSHLWSRISQRFASRSKAKVMQYKLKLQTLKKGTMCMKDYLNKMKGYMDTLAACGHPITDEDQILHILGGVGLEYDS